MDISALIAENRETKAKLRQSELDRISLTRELNEARKRRDYFVQCCVGDSFIPARVWNHIAEKYLPSL